MVNTAIMTSSHVYFPKLDLSLISRRPSRDAETKFPCKLHRLLQDVEEENLTHIISWHRDGKCFRVHEPDEFVEKILPRYFKKSKFRSFQRQLNLYSFTRITAVKPFWESCYYHPDFSRDDELGCRKINRPLRRKQNKKEKEVDMINLDDFFAPNQSNEAIDIVAGTRTQEVNRHDPALPISDAAVVDEDTVKEEIYEATYNEHALTRRSSYQDLCESIMGADCEACKDGAKLMDDILQDDNIGPEYAV